MKSQLYIPNKIKVGYQERKDTYTQRLAYVIYYDDKGVLRKESSWKGWIDKGNPTGREYVSGKGYVDNPELIRDPLPTHDFDNVPTEGFVLNKKAGGYSTGWNHRQTYCRVYDPRGFEFEITIPNLLFILQETSSFKGKGLEGEFVYSWDGKDLVLLPAGCDEYKQSKGFTDLQKSKVSVKDLVAGCTYQTKKQENLIYLGRFEWFTYDYVKDSRWTEKEMTSIKQHIFVKQDGSFLPLSSLTTLALKVSDEVISNYAEFMDKFKKSKFSSAVVDLQTEKIDVQLPEEESYYRTSETFKKISDHEFIRTSIRLQRLYDYRTSKYTEQGYTVGENSIISFKDGKVREKRYSNTREKTGLTKEEVLSMNFVKLNALTSNGELIDYKTL